MKATSRRFYTPASSLSLKSLMRKTKQTLLITLGIASLVHFSLIKVGGFSTEHQAAKPLTTQFIKRQPRLTKPLEMKKRPRPKRRQMKRRMVSVKARVDRKAASVDFRAVRVLGNLARPKSTVNRAAVFDPTDLEPQTMAEIVEGVKESKNAIDMTLEMVDTDALDMGQYQAAVIQDPMDKRNIRGFFHLAHTYRADQPPPRWWNHDSRRPAQIANLVAALNKYTDIKADLRGSFTFDNRELLKVPFVYFLCGFSFKITEGEADNLGDYLLVGGLLLAESTYAGIELPADTSIRQMMRDALHTKGIEFGRDWSFEKLPNEHPIYHCYFDFKSGPPIAGDHWFTPLLSHVPGRDPYKYLEGIEIENRLVAIVSKKWLGNAWGDWGPGGYPGYGNLNPTRALQFGVNIVIFALTQEGSITHRVMSAVQ